MDAYIFLIMDTEYIRLAFNRALHNSADHLKELARTSGYPLYFLLRKIKQFIQAGRHKHILHILLIFEYI